MNGNRMGKKRVIVRYDDLKPEVLEALEKKYPDGIENHVFKVNKKDNDFFYAITVDTEDTSYLVKVNVSVDAGMDEYDHQDVIYESNSTGKQRYDPGYGNDPEDFDQAFHDSDDDEDD